MSAPLGYFSDDERDFPELNKCPDCETFFADLYCPLCGKECPEEMRAGNRKPVKIKKRRSSGGSGRVQFVPWYFSSWFIILMLITMPIAGLILLWMGYWKKIWKIVVTVLLVLGYVLAPLASAAMALYLQFESENDIPVNTRISKAEYISLCEETSPELLFREAVKMTDLYISVTLTVSGVWENSYDLQYDIYIHCYAFENGKRWEFLVRDFRQDDSTNLTEGDVITVYGQMGGNTTISNYTAGDITAPCINMLYFELQ